jgi:hypothetical protein
VNKEHARDLLKSLVANAREVGIYEKMFISFGTLLGAIRPTINRYSQKYTLGFMEHDDDMDVSFLPIPHQSRRDYFNLCKNGGLMHGWPHPENRIECNPSNGDILWFSAKKAAGLTKCCNWFWTEKDGYLFHSKGDRWPKRAEAKVKHRAQGFRASMLGIRGSLLKDLVEIDFEGMRVNIPVMAGSVLDHWYSKWFMPAGGSSEHKTICYVRDWGRPESWVIKTK